MPKVPESRLRAAAIARDAWAVKTGYASVQARLRIPSNLKEEWKRQDTSDRGSYWADGTLIGQEIRLLYRVIERLSGRGVSIIIGNDVTLVVEQQSFTAKSHVEALLKAIAYYLPPENLDDLEPKLKKLDLLE